ncbi:MAG: flagellar hook protein FlgE, partial [Gemmatimonadetes bacterium]|nr:flagellar hook protein FlgE [Gemmatimonadota bacterium]
NHQVRMDVIANNIANVNTIGFKGSRVTFEEAFSQLLQGPSQPRTNGASFGTNAMTVGLGMNLGSIDMNFTQGSLQTTGVNTDLAIQGNSFFVVGDGTQNFYTRAGNFQIDGLGRLVSSNNGFIVQGRLAQAGVLQQTVGDLTIPLNQRADASATTTVGIVGNLDAAASDGLVKQTLIVVYDSQGNAHDLVIDFTKTANPNEWTYAITTPNGTPVSGDTGTITFDSTGALVGPGTTTFEWTPDNFTANESIEVSFGTVGTTDGLSQFASPSTAVISQQDGFPMGELERILVDETGTVTGAFTNGVNLVLGQVVLADFANARGLLASGDNMFSASANSGPPVLGFVSEGSQSAITAGALEMSNVDLASEFTDMIVTQRGFQSNARVITTADEMLQELVALRR